jgi:hypothetical protein
VAASAIVSVTAGAWLYFGLWLPASVSQLRQLEIIFQHMNKDTQNLAQVNFNALRRAVIANRIEVYQGRITILTRNYHEAEDAILVHKRVIDRADSSFDDKDISRRRIATLTDELDIIRARLRIAYVEVDRLRALMVSIPYDPKFGDADEIKDPDFRDLPGSAPLDRRKGSVQPSPELPGMPREPEEPRVK